MVTPQQAPIRFRLCYLPWKLIGKRIVADPPWWCAAAPGRHSCFWLCLPTHTREPTMNVVMADTIDDLRMLAAARLPRAVFDFIDGAADDELTLGWNARDFDKLAWRPRMLVDVSHRDCATRILNERADLPLIVAPTGLAALAWAGAD